MADYTILLNAIEADLAISGAYYDLVANGGRMVHKYGNETISGIKNFTERPTVNGVGVLLSGEGGTGSSGGTLGPLVTGISGAFGANISYGTGVGQVIWGDGGVVSGSYATVIGGLNNRAIGASCVVMGGTSSAGNIITGTRCSIINGVSNRIEAGQNSFIAGGQSNVISGINNFTAGRQNVISGSVGISFGGFNSITGNNNICISPSNSFVGGNSSYAIGSFARISGYIGAGIIASRGDSNYTYSSGDYTLVIASNSGVFVDSSFILAGSSPSTSSDPCYKGQIAVDSQYVYVGTGVNQWGRVALSSF